MPISITLEKGIFYEEYFREVVKRMGWRFVATKDDWIVELPEEEEELFEFVFGV